MDIKVMTRIYASRFYHSRSCSPTSFIRSPTFIEEKPLGLCADTMNAWRSILFARYPFGIAHQMSVPEENQQAIRELPRDAKTKTHCPRL